ncbi:MAG: hypothetical protein N3I35_10435 [Clostridia bacterium]|nr:hypothetical protein [Clostridia bacterium]
MLKKDFVVINLVILVTIAVSLIGSISLISFTAKRITVITPPKISEIKANSATIVWSTDVKSIGHVYYTPVTDYSLNYKKASEIRPETDHEVTITGLDGGATYVFYVESINESGQTRCSRMRFVTPDKFSITRNPVIYHSSPTEVDIYWGTDLESQSRFKYWTEDMLNHQIITTSIPKNHHKVTLKDLMPGTSYSFDISCELLGSSAKTGVYTFKTMNKASESSDKKIEYAREAVTSPYKIIKKIPGQDISYYYKIKKEKNLPDINISDIKTKLISSTKVKIEFSTDIECSASLLYKNKYDIEKHIQGSTKTRCHSFILTGLTPDMKYTYKILCSEKDFSGYVKGNSFNTPKSEYRILDEPVVVNDPSGKLKIQWSTNIKTKSYIVFRKAGGGYTGIWNKNFEKHHSFTLDNLEKGVKYEFYVGNLTKESYHLKSSIKTFVS